MHHKKHFHITVENKNDVTPELMEAVRILYSLVQTTDKWKSEYGAHNREAMDRWRNKARTWLAEHVSLIDEE